MELIIYDRELNRKGIIENQTSIIWTRKYYEPGNFEIHAPITKENLSLLSKGNLISKKDGIEAGVIESVENSENSQLNEITVKGRFLSSYLDRRLIKQTFTFNGFVEVAMRNLINYVDSIPLLELGTLNNFNETVTFQATMKNLLSIITKLSKTSLIGYRIVPDYVNKQLKFETYKGVDRTSSQNISNRVIFTESYNNLNQATYRWNDQLLKTLVIVGGEGEGANRKYINVGGGSGLDLRELFVDARDISSDNMTTQEYDNALRQRGLEALSTNIIAESFEYETNAAINFIYGIHYDLGDIVTVNKKDWGIKINQRITEVQEIYESGGVIVAPTLGDPLPDKIDWSDK